MNVFDFDKTLYRADSTVDFWLFALRHVPACRKDIPAQAAAAVRFGAGRMSKDDFKGSFYRFLKRISNPEALIEAFWATSLGKMNEKVLAHAHEGDLVVSASPQFLLEIPCAAFGLDLIASKVDMHTGQLLGPNCHGPEKVVRIAAAGFPLEYEKGFSDSLSDVPMLELAREPFLVTRRGLKPLELRKASEEGKA